MITFLSLGAEIPNLRSGRPFKYVYIARRTNRDYYVYQDRNVIRQTLVAVSVNAYVPQTMYCNYTLEVRFFDLEISGEHKY